MLNNQNVFIPSSNAVLLLLVFLISLYHQSLQLTECQFTDISDNPCIHGICLAANNSQEFGYQCYCFDGYTGLNCTKKFDHCLHQNPCQNNATCKNLENKPGVVCICNPGYCGKYCESEVNECVSNPCLNRGVCVDKVNDFMCKCPKGYIGKRCETDVNVCTNHNSSLVFDTTLCYNGGTCVDGPGDLYFCACSPGYTGQRCQYKVRECNSNPCLNGGRCEDKEADFECTCNLDWTGKRCELPLVECKQNICKNGGICLTVNSSQTNITQLNVNVKPLLDTFCYCLPDFYGPYCQNNYNECTPNPCLNNGQCLDGIDSYVCKCVDGFMGSNCQIDCSDLINQEFCFISLNGSVTDSSTLIETTTIAIMSSMITESIEIFSSLSPIDINSTYIQSTSTPIISTNDILDSFLSPTPWMSETPVPTLTATASSYIPESSPTFEPNITIPTNITTKDLKVFIPRFNGFNSSLIYRSVKSKRDCVSISLNIKADNTSTGSLIIPVLYSKSKDNHEIILYIQNNTIKALVTKESKKILNIESKFKITAKVFHKIYTKLWISNQRLNYILNINDSLKTGGSLPMLPNESADLCSFDVFYLGSLPVDNGIPFLLTNHSNPISLCIGDVLINKYEMFIRDALKMSDISECDSSGNVCHQNPCRNEGVCQSDGHNDWQCICPEGYTSTLCERSHCSDQLCLNDGICILPDRQTYLCICPHGWSGKNCQLKSNQTMASFNSEPNKKSFIKYNVKNLTDHLEIKFRFATLEPNQTKALILFMGNQYNRTQKLPFIVDFLSVSLESGILYFRINLGHGTKILSTPIITGLREQLVFFGHHRQFVWLIVIPEEVDKTKPIVGETPLTYHALNVSPHLYVGGHDRYAGYPFIGHSWNGFKGCIYDIEIRDHLNVNFWQLSDDYINKSINTGVCNLIDDCHHN